MSTVREIALTSSRVRGLNAEAIALLVHRQYTASIDPVLVFQAAVVWEPLELLTGLAREVDTRGKSKGFSRQIEIELALVRMLLKREAHPDFRASMLNMLSKLNDKADRQRDTRALTERN